MTTKKTFGNRKFYSLPEEYPLRVSKVRSSHAPKKTEEISKLIKYIDENVIGRNHTFTGPYGRRKVVYCDYTASGRSLQFIEDYILREVLPCYGNTHTTTSTTAMQSTLFRHEARDIIRNAVHASEHDAVIFAGSGCTGAVHKLIHALALADAPVVFVGPFEHHSNLLPWRELGATIVRIAETREGVLDLLDLERQLSAHQGCGRQLLGCFSAASNITGILADDVATTLLLHQYGALAFWDYAAAAPYVKLDMNPILPGVDETSVHKDAMFFSMHKFVGGVQTPGVLVAKRSLFRCTAPQGCGGGSVFFVTRDSHTYLQIYLFGMNQIMRYYEVMEDHKPITEHRKYQQLHHPLQSERGPNRWRNELNGMQLTEWKVTLERLEFMECKQIKPERKK